MNIYIIIVPSKEVIETKEKQKKLWDWGSFNDCGRRICLFDHEMFSPASTILFNAIKCGNLYYWAFGDGNTSHLMSPSHLYAGHVTSNYMNTFHVSRYNGYIKNIGMAKMVIALLSYK